MHLLTISTKVVNMDLVTDMTIDPVDGSVTVYFVAAAPNTPPLTFNGLDAAQLRGWLAAHTKDLTPDTDDEAD